MRASSNWRNAVTVAKPIPIGAKIVDSLPFSQAGTLIQAKALKAAGAEGVALYLGVAKWQEADECLAAGLGIFGVTIGDHFDGAAAHAQMVALGMANGTSAFLDFEGPATLAMTDDECCAKIDAWADKVDPDFLAGMYLAPPQPLTSKLVYARPKIRRYWKGGGSLRARNGIDLVEPDCGWCMTQAWPSRMFAGVWVDVDQAGEDFHGRSAVWSISA